MAEKKSDQIGGLIQEDNHGYQIRGLDGQDIGYFWADQYLNITFEIWWPSTGTETLQYQLTNSISKSRKKHYGQLFVVSCQIYCRQK